MTTRKPLAKNAIKFSTFGEQRKATRRPVNRRFASTAFGEGYGDMTPAERAARKAWLEDSYARERQLVTVAGQSLRGYADAPLADRDGDAE